MRPVAIRFCAAAALFGACHSIAFAGEIVCASIDGETRHCALPHADKMKVRLKIDREGGCKKNDTWGVDDDGVWVDIGCQAVFTYKDPSSQSWWRKVIYPARR